MLALKNRGESGSNIGRREQRTFDDVEDLVSGLGATAVAVVVEEVDDPLMTELENVIGVGAKSDQCFN